MRRDLLFHAIAALLLVYGPGFAMADNWIGQVLPERDYDAGTVARGSKVHHTFLLTNRLNQDVRILDWKTKCGCTDVKVGARVVPPGTQTTIEAVIDTTRFEGPKHSGLTLVLDRPQYAEVDLNFSCFIRTDLTLSPGFVDFGRVTRTSDAKPTQVTLTLTHARGRPNWGVTRMRTQTSSVSAKLQEQSRTPDGMVQYLLTATFDPSEVEGVFKDEITLYTNDAKSEAIPIAVTANVQSALTVSPSSLLFGRVKPGQIVTRTLLVRGTGPFTIQGVSADKGELTSAPGKGDARPTQTVTLTFKAPSQPGPFNAEVTIRTDLKEDPIAKITTFATIEP